MKTHAASIYGEASKANINQTHSKKQVTQNKVIRKILNAPTTLPTSVHTDLQVDYIKDYIVKLSENLLVN